MLCFYKKIVIYEYIMESDVSSLITPEENRIRKRWLIFTIVTWVIPASLILLLFIICALLGDLMFLLATLLPIVGLSICYSVYCCVYKKHGTAWLTFSLICIALGFIGLIVELLTVSSPNLGVFLFLKLLNFVYLSLSWIFDFQLRKVNKKIQIRKIKNSKEYPYFLSILESCTHQNELKEKYTQIWRENEDYERNIIDTAYQDVKKALKLKKHVPSNETQCTLQP